MKVQVTEQDLQESTRIGAKNPLARAIQRAAGGRWYVYGPLACEIISPYRAVELPREVCRAWQHCREAGSLQPFEFDLEIPQRSAGATVKEM